MMADDQHLSKSVPKEGWLALLVSFAILSVSFSLALFSLPVFYPVWTKRFAWTHAQAAAGGSIVLLLIGTLGPLIGWLADKYTPKVVALAGMILGALSLLLLSVSTTLPQFYASCVVLGIATASVSLVPASLLIAPWFSKRRGLAIGVINAGVGVGGFVAPVLTTFLIARHGAAGALRYLALTPALPFALTILLIRESPSRMSRRQATSSARRPALAGTALFWILGLSLLFAAHALTGIQQHLVLYLRGQGVNPSRAALALSTLLGASAFGKIIGGALADRFSARVSLIVNVLLLVAGIGGLLVAAPQAGFIFWVAALFGLGYGGVFNAPSILAFEYFGTESVGILLGLLMMFFGLGTSSGGLVAGWVYDRTHRYPASFTLDLASCLVALLLLALAGRRRFLPLPPSPR
jgi:MFS family permease